MCGLNGILRLTSDAPPIEPREVLATSERMAARGPDGHGVWTSRDGRVSLAHRRLAIIDLSEAAAQPFHSADGRFVIVFNGEIYNFRELRARLQHEGTPPRTTSDTEAVLSLFARRGKAAFSLLRGMFAIAIWDQHEHRLTLARDRFGIKPLYVADDGRCLRFASQVKALEAGGRIARDVDPEALFAFLCWGSIPEPLTLRRSVRALPAGHSLETLAGRVGEPEPFSTEGPGLEAEDLGLALQDSVQAHLVSDVPVGIFLSAGLDSALVAALAQRRADQPLRSFTLAFDEFRDTPLDEAPGAKAVAAALGLRHEERRVSSIELEELWDATLRAMDQPSIDGFNVYAVSRYAHEAGLKVVLSGIGGDELLGGYPSFRDVPRLLTWARRLGRIPALKQVWPTLAKLRSEQPKLAGALLYGGSLPGAYFLRRGLFLPEEAEVLLADMGRRAGAGTFDPLRGARAICSGFEGDDWEAVQCLETRLYLRNQLLRDADWASMAHSLELRVPFVDEPLAAAAKASSFEPARSAGKAALLRELWPEIPASILTRRKSGFMMPSGRPGRDRRPWGLRARERALKVLSAFGIDLPPLDRRGGTLFLAGEAFRNPGGIQRHTRNVAQALRRARPLEPLRAWVLNDAPDEVRHDEWRHVRARGFGRRHAAFLVSSLVTALGRPPLRIVLGHRRFLPLAPALALVAPRAELWLLVYGVEAAPPLGVLERLGLACVGRVLAISPDSADVFGRAGCRREVELLPCSLPFDWQLPADAPAPMQLPHRMLTVARLDAAERYKGVDDTLRALAGLRAQGHAAVLDVVGDGNDRPRLERLASELGLSDAVRFLGRLSDQALRERYAACDLFVLPSAAEGFGIVYLEAFAHGRAVVAAGAGGAPFVVRPHESGVLVPFGQPDALQAALGEVLSQPELVRRLGAGGRRELEQEFSFERLVQRVNRLASDKPTDLHPSAPGEPRMGGV